MTSMTQRTRETDEQWATRVVLTDYRLIRVHGRKDPYYASRDVLNDAARHLADVTVDGGGYPDLASLRYRTARRIHAEVCRRADVGNTDRKFKDLTVCEQYWQSGHVAGASS